MKSGIRIGLLLKVLISRRCRLLQCLILINIACFFSLLTYYTTVRRMKTSSMLLKSTCSEQADLRGPNQRIISYSVYGNLSDPYIIQRYLKPMLSNIEDIHELYPGNDFRYFQLFKKKTRFIFLIRMDCENLSQLY